MDRILQEGQLSIKTVKMPLVVPKIVHWLVEYHAHIGCYQCYLFLDSHLDSTKQTKVFNVNQLCLCVDFPYVELRYMNSKDEKSRPVLVWQTEIERNVDVTQSIVERKEDHWYLRLPIRPSDKQPLGGFSSFTQVSSAELQPQNYASVCCRACKAQLLGTEGKSPIEKVLPLPSANWMDMCDFWGAGVGAFEHIPREDIHAQLHRVLVGESYILLHASDLVAKAVAIECGDETVIAPRNDAKEEREWVSLACVACSEPVGLRSVEQPETVRLHKHHISAHQVLELGAVEKDQENEDIFGNYTIDSILSAKLLEMVDSDGIFRFVLTSSGDNDNPSRGIQGSTGDTSTELQLQLLSWETMIKHLDTNKFCRVLKVLYSPRQPMALFPSHDVLLPPAMCLALTKRLQASTTLLPSSLRAFNQMNVGYLFA